MPNRVVKKVKIINFDLTLKVFNFVFSFHWSWESISLFVPEKESWSAFTVWLEAKSWHAL